METPKEYYCTYYSYEEWGRGYFGSRGCKCLPEEDIKYFGTFRDKTFRPTHKIILKDDYATREEAYADEIILHDYYDVANNPHFANRAKATSTSFYYIATEEEQRKNGIKGGKMGGDKSYELGLGAHGRSKEQMSKDGRKNGRKVYELGKGIFARTPEQISKDSIKGGKISGNKNKELGKGIFARTPEQIKENSRNGANKTKELGVGIHSRTKEQKSEDGKKGGKVSASQRWQCTETKYISTASGLAKYQKARNIYTSKRVRIA
jgi:hypothetical protein